MHTRIAVAVGHIDVPCGDIAVCVQRWNGSPLMTAPVRRDAKCQQHLSRERALADRVVAVVGELDRVVGRHDTPWARGTGLRPNERRKLPSRSNTIMDARRD